VPDLGDEDIFDVGKCDIRARIKRIVDALRRLALRQADGTPEEDVRSQLVDKAVDELGTTGRWLWTRLPSLGIETSDCDPQHQS